MFGRRDRGPEIVGCPEDECLAPAEVVDRFDLPSTEGPVRHVVTSCLRRHHITRTED